MNVVLQPPFASRTFPGQWFWRLQKNPPEALAQLAQQGPVVSLGLGKFRVVLISQAEFIHQVLVKDSTKFAKGPGQKALRRLLGQGLLTSEGELHRRQRQWMQPVFQAQRVGSFAPEMVGCTEYLLSHWPEQGQILAGPEMTRLTMQIVGQCLFGTDLKDEVGEVRAALQQGMELARVANLPVSEWLERLYPPLRKRLQQTRQRLDAVVFRMLEEHQRCPHQDLLGRMLQSPMSPELLRDELMTLFLAGHETTAHALTFALYLLARHPQVQQELRQELQCVCPQGRLEMEHLQHLIRTKETLLETLRLYPPAWIQARQALEEVHLGPYRIEKGTLVLMSQYVMHRHPNYFEQADQFVPARWQTQTRQSLPKGSYFPFGMGPRVCIGEHFAWLEMLLGLGTLLQHYELVSCPVARPKLRPRVTLAAGQELPILVRRLT